MKCNSPNSWWADCSWWDERNEGSCFPTAYCSIFCCSLIFDKSRAGHCLCVPLLCSLPVGLLKKNHTEKNKCTKPQMQENTITRQLFSLIERLGVYRCASLLLAFCISLSTLSLSLGSIPKTQRLTLRPSIESSHWLIAVINMNVCRWTKAMLSSWQNFLDLIAGRNSIWRNGIETMKERLTRKRKKKKRNNFSHDMPYGSACQRQYTVT